MDAWDINLALQRLAESLEFDQKVELLLVGAAAGILTGALPRQRVTLDCDVMLYVPQNALGAVEHAAEAIATELGLPATWLNSDVQIRGDTLPDDWQARSVLILDTPRMKILAVHRQDLLAMKVLAGRPKDIEDIRCMKPSMFDWGFVRKYIANLPSKGTPEDQIVEASRLLEILANEAR